MVKIKRRKPKVERTGPRTLVGQEFYEIEELGCWSFCPDSDDASTPATQVHAHLTVHGLDRRGKKKVFQIGRAPGRESVWSVG